MHGFVRLQVLGPLVLFFVVLAAESVACALVQAPSAALLWYLNLEVFGLVRASRTLMGELGAYPFSQLVIVGPLALAAMIGLAWRRHLLLAIASNLSLVYAGFLLYGWQFYHSIGPVRQVSLAVVGTPTGYDLSLVATLLVASLVSSAISHVLYLRETWGRT